MNMGRSLIVPVALVCALARTASADELTAEKKANIARLLEVTHALAIGTQFGDLIIAQVSDTIRHSDPNASPEMINLVTDEVKATIRDNVPELTELMIGIYHRHFTAEEVKGILAFYSTPIGRKVADLGPTLTAEGIAAGQKWGESLRPKLQHRVQRRLEESVPDAGKKSGKRG
jgi:uncharacterized protein